MVRRKGNIKKGILSGIVLAAAVALSAPILSYAERGASRNWGEYAQTPGTNIRSVTLPKATSSSVYSVYRSGSSQFVGVRVYASKSATTGFSDVTYGGPYYVYAGAGNGIEVMNLAYENKGRGCRTFTLYTTISAGWHQGSWTADIY
ncbi:MAG: hypothetical protein K2I03_06300 [Lachnospiraceae bacterium]|nr:hypothetical protein [Lachnospiraceae bacterium]